MMMTSRTSPHPFIVGLRIAWATSSTLESLSSALVHICASPVFTALFYVLLASSPKGFGAQGGAMNVTGSTSSALSAALAAVIGTCCIETCVAVSSTLSLERFEGTLPFVLLSPKPPIFLWLGCISGMLAISVLSSCVALVSLCFYTPILSMSAMQWLAVFGLMVISVLVSACMGMCIAAVSLPLSDAFFLVNLTGYILPLVSGAVADLSIFPAYIRIAVYVIPVPWMTQAVRLVGVGQGSGQGSEASSLTSLGLYVIGGLSVALLWLGAAGYAWKRSVDKSRRDDTISSLGL